MGNIRKYGIFKDSTAGKGMVKFSFTSDFRRRW